MAAGPFYETAIFNRFYCYSYLPHDGLPSPPHREWTQRANTHKWNTIHKFISSHHFDCQLNSENGICTHNNTYIQNVHNKYDQIKWFVVEQLPEYVKCRQLYDYCLLFVVKFIAKREKGTRKVSKELEKRITNKHSVRVTVIKTIKHTYLNKTIIIEKQTYNENESNKSYNCSISFFWCKQQQNRLTWKI